MNLISIPVRNKVGGITSLGYRLVLCCYLLSFLTQGFGSTVYEQPLYVDISTLFVVLALVSQVITNTIRIPKILAWLYLYLFSHGFIFNYNSAYFMPSFKHYLGLVVYSLSFFSFFLVHKDKILRVATAYYRMALGLAAFVVIQELLCVLFDNQVIIWDILFGNILSVQRNLYVPEILGILPRAVGLSSEPANYAVLMLPGVYFALMVVIGKGRLIGLTSRSAAWLIIIAFLLSFSLVGYFGLAISIIVISWRELKRKYLARLAIALPFIAVFVFIIQYTPLFSKIVSMVEIAKDVRGYEYTTSDLSGYALLSNALVAQEALRKSFYFGTGINTHQYNYDETILSQFSASQIIHELNRENAGSLFIRLTSEYGLPGIFAFCWFLWGYKLKDKDAADVGVINTLCCVALIGYSVRNGHYLSTYLWFFAAMYYYSNKQYADALTFSSSGKVRASAIGANA